MLSSLNPITQNHWSLVCFLNLNQKNASEFLKKSRLFLLKIQSLAEIAFYRKIIDTNNSSTHSLLIILFDFFAVWMRDLQVAVLEVHNLWAVNPLFLIVTLQKEMKIKQSLNSKTVRSFNCMLTFALKAIYDDF